ncbi:MFS transporter [Tumebacillus algifaecis]|uniref:MFS transporter n=1 Tax=Tumebacillus algifaecis TaxID=1214604 RepID=A0A223CXP5_9BACL|nr:MFS transporter [Tumebacillus algifaecis]ASS74061.1 MFS transporter [Tumebacillus algifaecis]
MERLWTQNFVRMMIANLLLFTSFYFLTPTLPLFVSEMGASASQVGIVIGIFTLSAVVIRPFIGGLLDRVGRRSFVLIGLLVFGLTMYLYNWTAAIGALIALRIFHGLSWAVSTTAIGTAVTDIIPPRRRGEGMGWFGLSMTVGMALGPMFGLIVLDNSSFHLLFLVTTGLGLAAFVLALLTKMPFARQKTGGKIVLFEKSVLPMMVLGFLLAVTYGGITSFFPLFAEEIHVNAGTFFIVYAITLTLTRPIAGKLSDRFGELVVLIPTVSLIVCSLIVLSLAHGTGGVVATAILYGLGFGSAQPILQSAMIRVAPADRKGVANASFFTALDLGIGLGTIILGYVSQLFGYRVLFAVCTVFGIAGLLFTLFLVKKQRSKLQSPA